MLEENTFLREIVQLHGILTIIYIHLLKPAATIIPPLDDQRRSLVRGEARSRTVTSRTLVPRDTS